MTTVVDRSSWPIGEAGPGNAPLLESNRAQLDLDLRDSPHRKYQSPALLALHRTLTPRIQRHLRGRVLDVGCGGMPFRGSIADVADEYRSLDVEARVPGVDYISDARDMRIVDGATFDGILCSEVLEHVTEPERVLRECIRILVPGGVLVLSVPCLSRLHEEPHDYYRYTTHGLRFLLEQTGFQIREIVPTASVFSFVGHQVSTAILCSTWHIPVLRNVAFWSNAALVTVPAEALDRMLGLSRRFPLGYVAVAEKPLD